MMTAATKANEPVLQRDSAGRIDYDCVPEVIQWFLDYDDRHTLVIVEKPLNYLRNAIVIDPPGRIAV